MYKHCCEVKAGPMSRHKWLVLVAGVLVIVSGVWTGKAFFSSNSGSSSFSQPPGAAPPGKVWSPEHGHYHDAPQGQSPSDSGQTDSLQAAGPAPR